MSNLGLVCEPRLPANFHNGRVYCCFAPASWQALSGDHGRQAPPRRHCKFSTTPSGTLGASAPNATERCSPALHAPGHTWQSPQRLETDMARWRPKPAWPIQRLTAQSETQGNWCPGNPILERGTVPHCRPDCCMASPRAIRRNAACCTHQVMRMRNH